MRRLVHVLVTLGLTAACATTPPATPEGSAAAAQSGTAPRDDFRQAPPKPGAPPEIVLPRFEEARLSNGMTILVATRKELPLVSVGIAFAAGSAQDPAGRAGVSDLAYRMLLEGAAGKDAIALDVAFADLGSSASVSVQPDGAFVGTQVLARNAEAALALLADVVRRPTFSAQDFERRKKQQLADLARRLGSPPFLAQVAYLRALYGPGHPYAHPVGGTPATLAKVGHADVKGFYRRHVGPQATALIVTGDVTMPQAIQWAQKYFGAWKGGAKRPAPPPAPPAPPRQSIIFVPKPGLNQTIVSVGRPGLALGHPDEYALELASTVFGSFFGSRLNMNLREAKGYSYGARSSLDARYGVGPLTASSAVRADVTGPALTEVVNELKGLKERPITQTELEAAREGLVRSFPGSFETVEGLAGAAAQLYFAHRPLDEFQRSVEGLKNATAAEVQRVAEAYFEPGAMQIVLVGDPEVVRQQVGPLGFGELVTRSVDDPAAGAKKK